MCSFLNKIGWNYVELIYYNCQQVLLDIEPPQREFDVETKQDEIFPESFAE